MAFVLWFLTHSALGTWAPQELSWRRTAYIWTSEVKQICLYELIVAVKFFRFFTFFMKIQIWLLTVAQSFIWIAEDVKESDLQASLISVLFEVDGWILTDCIGTATLKHRDWWQLRTVYEGFTFSFWMDNSNKSVQVQGHNSTKWNSGTIFAPQCSPNCRAV